MEGIIEMGLYDGKSKEEIAKYLMIKLGFTQNEAKEKIKEFSVMA